MNIDVFRCRNLNNSDIVYRLFIIRIFSLFAKGKRFLGFKLLTLSTTDTNSQSILYSIRHLKRKTSVYKIPLSLYNGETTT